ncbi:acyltransferase domain-containing protein [Aquimarina sp. RZ0]|uniref:acyltransferase domain-containing protein n=1 Tax=Aquimarina sp. RZ0 TaxID=2607730 RepID=UPI0011F14CCC|nr:acyltransferase domain-containing protein [Aquimarina sp. RZ0]KAA1246061.1 acyltransferase domain-containing protein [Aquimarina sp. RZ0]
MKDRKLIFHFSGQGSHYRGMGYKLYEGNKVFKTSLEKSEVIIKKNINRSLINELYYSKEENFDDLLITHPAIVSIEIAIYELLKSMGIVPDYTFGSSLGEFAAGVVCGIWDASTAINASIEQAKSIINSNIEGGMLVIINQDKGFVENICTKYSLFLAAHNFEDHFTISGMLQNISACQSELEEYNIQFFRLAVQVPFHSPLIPESLNNFRYYMNIISPLNKPKLKFISGSRCKEVDVKISQDYFSEVVTVTTNYPKLIDYVESKGTCLYIDLGPSGTGSNFVKNNLDVFSKSKTFKIMTSFKKEFVQIEKLKKILNNEL